MAFYSHAISFTYSPRRIRIQIIRNKLDRTIVEYKETIELTLLKRLKDGGRPRQFKEVHYEHQVLFLAASLLSYRVFRKNYGFFLQFTATPPSPASL